MKNFIIAVAAIMVAILLAAAASGQTAGPVATVISGSIVKVPTITGSDMAKSIAVVSTTGTLQQAVLGQGLTIDWTTTPPTINAATVERTEYSGERMTSVGALSYKTAHPVKAGTFKLYRDGVRQTEGIDYTFEAGADGATITFVPFYAASQGTPLVTADYRGTD